MKYVAFIFLLVVLVVGVKCSNNFGQRSTPEEIAFEYFSDSVVQNKSVFQDTSAIMFHDWPEFDSTWISKGFLYKEILFASNLVTDISEPQLDKYALTGETRR